MPIAESMRTSFDYRPPPRTEARSSLRWLVSGLTLPIILGIAGYSLLTRGNSPAPASQSLGISRQEAEAMRAEFEALEQSHTEEEFRILQPGEIVSEDAPTTRTPETNQWAEGIGQVESQLRGIAAWGRSNLAAGWSVVTSLFNESLAGIRAYAAEYQRKRSTSLLEDISLSVFSNGLSQFLFAFFGAVLGVMFGRRRKRGSVAE